MYRFTPDIDCAIKLDSEDKLSSFRNEFCFPDKNLVYMDGNSLGRLSNKTVEELQHVVENEWGSDLIKSWNKSWFNIPVEIGNKIASIIGADDGEVIVGDSTSVNLFKLAVAALKSQPGRKKIISDVLNFPSDLYILQGVADFLNDGHYIELTPSHDGISINHEEVEKLIDNDTVLVCLSHVAFKSSFMYNMARITKAAHNYRALILWDLSHAVGAVPINLNKSDADLAVGCTYKYLNGGPGSPAFLFVRKNLQKKIQQPVWGWLGSKDPFSFGLDYVSSGTIDQFVSGSPPIISIKAINSGIELLRKAGMDNIRNKSLKQTEYLIYLAGKKLYSFGCSLGSPKNPDLRGSHVSICHPESFRINKAMIDSGIIPDFRAPDSIRIGITPLYTTYMDIYKAIDLMSKILENKKYENFSFQKGKAT